MPEIAAPASSSPLTRAVALDTLGSHGLNRWGGEVMEEFLVGLRGASGRRTYREMAENCPIVGALLQSIEMAIRAVTWTVKSASEAREDEAVAEFVSQCLFNDQSWTWEDTLSDILTMVPYGWAYGETVFKVRRGDSRDPRQRSRYSDGRIGLRKLVVLSQDTLDRWEFDEAGGVQGLWQQVATETKTRYIPVDKALLFRTTARRGNPEGRSILRSAYQTWYYRKNVLEILGIGLERDLTGLPVVYAPEGIDIFAPQYATQLSVLKQLVRDVKVDEQAGAVLPFGFKFELLASPGAAKHDAVAVLEYLDKRIALTALAQFLLLGMQNVGSFALAQSQSDLFILSLQGWVDGIRAVWNRHFIPRLLALNGLQVKTPPELVRGQIGAPNLQELASYVNQLTQAAVLNPDEATERYLREVASLPTLPEPGKEEAPRPTLLRERLMKRRDMLSEQQALRELGYSEELITRILQEKRAGRLAETNLGAGLLAAFEKGYLGPVGEDS